KYRQSSEEKTAYLIFIKKRMEVKTTLYYSILISNNPNIRSEQRGGEIDRFFKENPRFRTALFPLKRIDFCRVCEIFKKVVRHAFCKGFIIDNGVYLKVKVKTSIVHIRRPHHRNFSVKYRSFRMDKATLIMIDLHSRIHQRF